MMMKVFHRVKPFVGSNSFRVTGRSLCLISSITLCELGDAAKQLRIGPEGATVEVGAATGSFAGSAFGAAATFLRDPFFLLPLLLFLPICNLALGE